MNPQIVLLYFIRPKRGKSLLSLIHLLFNLKMHE